MDSKKTNQKLSEKHLNMLITFLLVTFILLIGLNNSVRFSSIGFVVIGALLFFSFYNFLMNVLHQKYILKKEKWIFFFAFLYIVIYFNGIFFTLSFESIVLSFQVSMIMFFFLGVTYISFNKINGRIIYMAISGFIIFHFLWWLAKGAPISFKGLMTNPNSFGGFLVFLSGIMILTYKHKSKKDIYLVGISIFLSLWLMFFSDSRATFLVTLTFLVTYYLWPIITKSKIVFNIYFMIFTGIIFVFTYGYSKISTSPIGYTLNEYSLKYTGKTFFSGRQHIWEELINLISKKILLGYGSEATPSAFIEGGLSAHNFYLQTTLQVGLLGITILFLLFLSIWNYLYLAKLEKGVRIGGSLLLGILIYLLFEVSLTQNNLAIAILQWLIVGLTVNYARHSLVKKKI